MLALLLLLGVVTLCDAGAQYYVYIRTADVTHAGSDSDIYIRIHGMKGSTSWYLCDLSGVDDFWRDDTDYYNFWRNEDVGQVLCVEFHTAGSDACLVNRVQVRTSTTASQGWTTTYNSRNTWLSRDGSEGVMQFKMCQNDCSMDLPLTTRQWALLSTDYDLDNAVVDDLTPTILDTRSVDATASDKDIETEYYITATATDAMTFSHTAGVTLSGDLIFPANPVGVNGTEATIETSTSYNYLHAQTLRLEHDEASWYGCRSPAGQQVTCTVTLEKHAVTVPYSQTWTHRSRGGCRWLVEGTFTRSWEGDLTQTLVQD